jgi:hypothetical protein
VLLCPVTPTPEDAEAAKAKFQGMLEFLPPRGAEFVKYLFADGTPMSHRLDYDATKHFRE